MKRSLAFITLLAIVFLSAAQSQRTTAARAGTKHKATVEFIDPVKLLNVTLKGRYIVIHDDNAMARGEACTFVYKENELSKPVVTFHCIPVDRARVSTFTYRTGLTPDGKTRELRELQFAGETEAHQVPMSIMRTAVVALQF